MNIKKLSFVKAGMLAVTACLLLGMTSIATAQNFQVSGKVINAKNQTPLIGVNILEVGTQNGTVTDKDGHFSLTVSGENASLRFSYIGFKTKTINVNGRSNITVKLQPSVTNLNQLVVTALGIKQKQRSIGYSVTQVQPENIISSTVSNTASLLQGMAAGVHVVTGSGGPGSAVRVTIRGVSSLTGNNQPLYVVDGVPISNANFVRATRYNGHAGGSGIGMINPDDIKSITVLKGASAAALYGSRARNGVVLITTKSGKGITGGPMIDVNTTVTVSSIISGFNHYQNVYGQGFSGHPPETQKEAINSGAASWGAKFDPSLMVPTFYGGKAPYVNHPNQLKNFYRNAVSTRNSITLAGGETNSSYYVNATHSFTPSIFPKSNLQQTNVTLRGTHSFLDNKLHADVKANFILRHHHKLQRVGDSPGNAQAALYSLPGNISLAMLKNHYIKPNGTEQNFVPAANFTSNPYWVINKFKTYNDKTRFIGFAQLSYDFTPWLSVMGRTGIDTYRLRHLFIRPYGTVWATSGGFLRSYNANVLQSQTELRLKLNHKITSSIGIHATFGATRNFRRTVLIGSNGTGFKIPGVRTISNMKGVTPRYSYSSKQINSLYGLVKLSYKNYLYITGTGRNDWSSTLPVANRSYFYPSVSGSFIFTSAFKSIMPDWLSFGKIRASWAVVGSDTDPYQLHLTYQFLPISFNDQSLAVVGPAALPNSTLKPTKSKAVSLGLHMGFLNNRVGFDFSIYKRKTTQQILTSTISVTSGYRARVINAGRVDNKGIEIALNAKPVLTKNVTWNVGLNFASDHTYVKDLAGIQRLLLALSRSGVAKVVAAVGHQYGTIRGTKWKRAPNGKRILSNGLPVATTAFYTLGRGTPDWTAGLNNTIHYKNWSLNFLLNVNWGGQIYSGTNAGSYISGLNENTLVGRAGCVATKKNGAFQDDCFVPKGVMKVTKTVNGKKVTKYVENTVGTTPAAFYGAIGTSIAAPFVYNDNYIKLVQAGLSYTLPQSLIAETPLQAVTVSIVGRNLAYLYNSVPNVNPEAALNAGNGQGLELAGLPATRSIGFSVDIKF